MLATGFLQNLRESNLLPDEHVQRIHARVEAQGVEGGVVGDLIQEGLLTSYQVQQLESGQGKGLVVGPYRILEEVGRGGFGCVYKAAHVMMDRVVALKVIAPERVEDQKSRTMFLREVRAATRLHHPNIALAYDAGEVDGRLFLAMEFIEGPNLDQLVRQQGPLSLNLAWPMLQQAAQALRCAHEQGMVHRDIKPANLLIPQVALGAVGRAFPDMPALVKVVDFGLARLQTQGTSATLYAGREKVFAGTPDFVSPEQARSLHNVDIRSDLYSLGCTFYYALTGRKPFHGNSALEIVLQHIEGEPDAAEHLRPELPPALAGCIRRLMAKRPEKRFQTPDELLAEMGFFSVGGGSQPVISLPSWPSISINPGSLPDLQLPPVPPLPPAPPPPPKRKSGVLARPALRSDVSLCATLETPLIDDALAARQALSSAGAMAASCVETIPQTAEPGAMTLVTDAVSPPAPRNPPAVVAAALPAGPSSGPAVVALPAVADVAPVLSHDLIAATTMWHALLTALVRGAHPGVDAARYKLLHARMLRAVRSHAESNTAHRALCQRLEGLIEPWMSLHSLTTTDPAMLRNLLTRSLGISAELGIPTATTTSPRWPVLMFLMMLVLALVGMSTLQHSGGRLSIHSPSLHAAVQLVQSKPVLAIGLLLPAGLLGAYLAVTRVART